MGKTLYLECCSGISGNMAAGALIDLGADREKAEKALLSLPLEQIRISITRAKRGQADTCQFQTKYEKSNLPSPCTLSDMFSIMEKADMTEEAKRTAKRIFKILAEAEARVQGIALDELEFGQTEAGDALAEIVAVAVCFDSLGITQVVVPRLWEGCGMICDKRDILPVPVPVAAQILSNYGLPVEITSIQAQLITPVGAAVAAALRTIRSLPLGMEIQRIGMGSGEEPANGAGFLRAMVINGENWNRDCICKLESNIDDCTGEGLGFVMERLMAAGARDVHYTPVYMKKNRPAYQLNVICDREDVSKLEQIIFEETTTIGIRHIEMGRTVLKRESRMIKTSLGEAKVKQCEIGSELRVYPEYESVKELCEKNHLAFQEVYERIKRESNKDSKRK